MMLAFQSADVGTLANMATPTGGATWTLLTSRQWNGTAGGKIWWKFAGGSEPATYGFTQGSGADGIVIVFSVSGTAATMPVFAGTGGTDSATVATPSVVPTGGDDLEFRFATAAGTDQAISWTPPAGYTLQEEAQSTSYTTGAVATKALTSGGATGSQNFTMSASMPFNNGFTVAVASLVFAPRRGLMVGQAVMRAATI
jgi:hypothetical protein